MDVALLYPSSQRPYFSWFFKPPLRKPPFFNCWKGSKSGRLGEQFSTMTRVYSLVLSHIHSHSSPARPGTDLLTAGERNRRNVPLLHKMASPTEVRWRISNKVTLSWKINSTQESRIHEVFLARDDNKSNKVFKLLSDEEMSYCLCRRLFTRMTFP